MSFSEGCVGGVEPETVTRQMWVVAPGTDRTRVVYDRVSANVGGMNGTRVSGPWVEASALRLVEEELRDWETTAKCSSDALRECEEELRQAREVAAKMKAHYEEALSNRDRAIASIRADRDRLAAALRKIAGQEPVKNALHPQWGAAHIADAALSPVQGEHPELRFEDVVWLYDRVNDAGYGVGCDGYTDEDIASVGAAMNNVGAWLHANARSDAPRGPSVRRILGEPAPPVQGEHEQGEPVWKNVPPLEDFMARIGMPLDGEHEQDGDTA